MYLSHLHPHLRPHLQKDGLDIKTEAEFIKVHKKDLELSGIMFICNSEPI